jgi:3-deoxy-D-manno-octulosonic-acid transferase
LGKIVYDIFLKAFALVFKIAALFNIKARLGVQGRKCVFSEIEANASSYNKQLIWMHCASLGEFEQGRPVLESLRQQYPLVTIVITFFSASGYEVMKNYKVADHIYYLPMDNSSNARRMIDALNPTLVLWVKYEFWYYYLHELKNRNIPVLLVSGIFRRKHIFFKWYGKIWRKMLLCFTHLFVQNESSSDLLATIGFIENTSVTGDTRFDRVINIAEKFEPLLLIEQFCGSNKVLVAGSTWDDDEAELTHYVRANPLIKFIIAPHEIDPENLKDVKKEFPDSIFYSELISNQQQALNEQINTPHVLIIDNVGMLSRLYQYADVTYVGGGFGADGVHNVLEAAVFGKPVIYGPEYAKYTEAIGLVECGGGISIENALELEQTLSELWKDEKLLVAKGIASKNYVYANKGASKKIIQFIQEKRLLTS